MPKNSKDTYQRIKKLFNSPPTPNQKAWGLINDFYHIILTVMEEKNISRTKLAERLGTSKPAVSKMLNNSPNISIRKMVNLAEAVGIDLKITTLQIEKRKEETIFEMRQKYKTGAEITIAAIQNEKTDYQEKPFKYIIGSKNEFITVNDCSGVYDA